MHMIIEFGSRDFLRNGAVAHKEFLALDFDSITNKRHIIYDVKNILPASIKDGGL